MNSKQRRTLKRMLVRELASMGVKAYPWDSIRLLRPVRLCRFMDLITSKPR